MSRPRSSFKYSTLYSFSFVLTLGQCFALFPINCVTEYNSVNFRFCWMSIKTLYSFTYLSLLGINMSFQIFNMTQVFQVNLNHIVPCLFYMCSFVTTLLFLKLAYYWPKLTRKWDKSDYKMKTYKKVKKLQIRLKLIAAVVMLTALLEHGLYLTTALLPYKDHKSKMMEAYMYSSFQYIFNYIPYDLCKGVVLFIINLMCTFTWNYMDLFIMVLSATLSSKFQQITTRLQSKIKTKDQVFWQRLREDYNAVAKLCRIVEKEISDIVFLSFANNIFVILIQIFNTLKAPSVTPVNRIYFTYSFAFLIVRTCLVAIYAAEINERSTEPTRYLLTVEPDVYNIEIERFLYKIQVDPCVFTGKRFFKVTKALIFNVAGAIITYELILIQFHVYAVANNNIAITNNITVT